MGRKSKKQEEQEALDALEALIFMAEFLELLDDRYALEKLKFDIDFVGKGYTDMIRILQGKEPVSGW